MPLYVPDTSVMLKWVLPEAGESHVAEALALLAAYRDGLAELVVPSLWQYEAGNVLGLHYPDIARDRLETLANLGVRTAELGPAGRALALELVAAHRVGFYDAAYHALALQFGGDFITADRRYHDKAVTRGQVKLLSEWQRP